jgi:hypothetical protein
MGLSLGFLTPYGATMSLLPQAPAENNAAGAGALRTLLLGHKIYRSQSGRRSWPISAS